MSLSGVETNSGGVADMAVLKLLADPTRLSAELARLEAQQDETSRLGT